MTREAKEMATFLVALPLAWLTLWTALWITLGDVPGDVATQVWIKVGLCVLASAPLMLAEGLGVLVLIGACFIAPYAAAERAQVDEPTPCDTRSE